MRLGRFTLLATTLLFLGAGPNSAFVEEARKWRADRETKLRAENGWLSLVARFPLKPGTNTIGTGKDNDIVFPEPLKGVGPERLGTLVVDPATRKVTLKLADGFSMTSAGKPFSGERPMEVDPGMRDWVSAGRMSFHVIERGGKYFLRLADNESPNRTKFPGCDWYPPDEKYKVQAKFIPHEAGKTIEIVNILNEASAQPWAGHAEFQLDGATYRLDAIQENDGLFIVFRDATAGDTTYGSGRFIDVAKTPKANETFTLDFNTAYNPPCAFSQYTTCPLPPKQNILKTRIEAGEKKPLPR